MNFIIIVASLFIHIIFIYKRQWLFDKRIFISIALTSFLLFGVSYALSKLDIGNPKFIPALKIPFLAVVVFFIMNRIFFQVYQRNPEDTFWSMDLTLMRDGIFNLLFWFIGVMIPAFLIYYLHI